ncbi:DUF488 domain-containing protein [Methylosinus sp. RM1]|uniref:DUF488 domain-containing protein n=1 Tax=Methylosinus sp. RM1 TaxID=2583817 RepID=UPI001409A69F|nr:DUF488 family protein [Methylosinus sp. RM1]
MFKIKRAYEPASAEDGKRILVDRLWPRGLSKAKAALDEWDRLVAPSDALRRWYAHSPQRWREFKTRYASELHETCPQELKRLRALGRGNVVTLLFASRAPELNNAAALKEIIETRRASSPAAARNPRPHDARSG